MYVCILSLILTKCLSPKNAYNTSKSLKHERFPSTTVISKFRKEPQGHLC